MTPKEIIKSYLDDEIDFDVLILRLDTCQSTTTEESFRLFHKAVNLISAYDRGTYTKEQFNEMLLDLSEVTYEN